MGSKRRTASLVATAMGALLLAPIQSTTISFASQATANPSTLSLSTGRMEIYAGDTSTAINPFSSLTTPVINGRAKFFYIINSGNFGLSRFTVTLTLPAGTAIANFRRCGPNIDFVANDTCGSGGYSSLTISANSATTFILTLPAGSFYALQLRQNKNTNLVINISANSAHINTSGVTNS
ncbi:MAG: hypothetical protein F2602_04415 [Actinobacteria bacterium]|uniref:Unannotated protein n=1 Tax=freshwater metagenome TaxID=449393 RepID=A0A6J6IP24_9ZZZZ|nr:hypothetical protein [Actinomycetota bacterium]MTA20907.1 hypothetical protein [Actinomycetota bacterium]